ncbi:MAG: NAD-dependent epimerase/dehydratase family protein [Porphyromonadaceae bacterium]|nr:NAD-dependent epimerase/dehydratase family protein [Porphyromonadaceae bacterium]
MKHTILGAGGSIGNALAHLLLKNGEDVRLVSRNAHPIEGTEYVTGDLTSYADTLEGVKQSDIVYLCAGLPYDTKIWKERWPKIIRNTTNACKEVGAKLIFFDNVYMYGKVDGIMTEETAHHPISRKGEVRAEISKLLEEEMKKDDLDVIIARAADLYGPFGTPTTSVPYMMVFDRLMHGKAAQWMADVNQPHSYTYIPDCAEGLCLLAKEDTAWNQIWHLPTHSPAIDGKTFINLAAREIGVEPKYTTLTKSLMRFGKLFNKIAREAYEMLYQNEYPYHFDSSKFNRHFNYVPVNYEEGIRKTIQWINQNKGR